MYEEILMQCLVLSKGLINVSIIITTATIIVIVNCLLYTLEYCECRIAISVVS